MAMGGAVTSIWFDEAASMKPHQFPKVINVAPPAVVRPVQVACRYCGAQPGTHCQRWRRTKRGKVQQNRDTPHPDRRYDAKLATTALTALIASRDNP